MDEVINGVAAVEGEIGMAYEQLAKRWKKYKYKNLTLMAVGILAALVLLESQFVQNGLLHLGSFGFLGAILAGIMFVATPTVALGMSILLVLAEAYPAWVLGILAGAGAMVADGFIFRFVRDDLAREVEPLYNYFGGRHLTHLLHTKYFSWTLPFVGAAIVASPLPDEVGVSLMGLSKMKTGKFLLISFVLNSVGIVLFILGSRVIKP